MPDISIGGDYPLKYLDNGDGTFSMSVGAGVTVAGGPATIADGSDVAEGAKADAAVTDPTASATVVALLKGIVTELGGTGLTAYRNLDLGVTGQVVKNGAGKLYTLHAVNVAVAARYIKVYNKATAPTAGDTPIFTFAVPASGYFDLTTLQGVAFASGISLRATTAIADADTGAPTANDVTVSAAYK